MKNRKISGVTPRLPPLYRSVAFGRPPRPAGTTPTIQHGVTSLQMFAIRALPTPKDDIAIAKELQAALLKERRGDLQHVTDQAKKDFVAFYLQMDGREEDLEDEYALEEEDDDDDDSMAADERRSAVARILRIKDDFERLQLKDMADSLVKSACRQVAPLVSPYGRAPEAWKEEIYERQREQLEILAELHRVHEGLVLCRAMDCMVAFDPSKVRSRRRCSVPGCFEAFHNCGCLISTCSVCHDTVCPLHKEAHGKMCATWLARRCGRTNGSAVLKPELCGAFGRLLHECGECSTMCCPKCRVPRRGGRCAARRVSEGGGGNVDVQGPVRDGSKNVDKDIKYTEQIPAAPVVAGSTPNKFGWKPPAAAATPGAKLGGTPSKFGWTPPGGCVTVTPQAAKQPELFWCVDCNVRQPDIQETLKETHQHLYDGNDDCDISADESEFDSEDSQWDSVDDDDDLDDLHDLDELDDLEVKDKKGGDDDDDDYDGDDGVDDNDKKEVERGGVTTDVVPVAPVPTAPVPTAPVPAAPAFPDDSPAGSDTGGSAASPDDGPAGSDTGGSTTSPEDRLGGSGPGGSENVYLNKECAIS
eukprot:CAMPEP_0194316100 /NCGR_PEP_ID=MMETSP0171-20130528/12909_1 /TAXON_ID=218684 /ORGANISM="Corethron pennatum, Strain L29A3" /LENGTH=586 /DNA_ID=CAMNT_0039072215 /DNA_START=30 /DNA_END=1790 /DNA_ORIENTATION=-